MTNTFFSDTITNPSVPEYHHLSLVSDETSNSDYWKITRKLLSIIESIGKSNNSLLFFDKIEKEEVLKEIRNLDSLRKKQIYQKNYHSSFNGPVNKENCQAFFKTSISFSKGAREMFSIK